MTKILTPTELTAVADLLADARIAHQGADIARDAADTSAQHQLRAKSRSLRAAAECIDPAHMAPEWKLG